MYDAVEEGLSHLKAAHWDRKVLIVISDGGDNASRHTLSQMLEDSARSNVLIYTVGFIDEHDGDQDLGVLRKIAHAAGGEAFFPTGSDEIVRTCRRIGEDIRHQYTIGYVSSNPKLDDTYRTIRVTAMQAHAGRLLVRTRAGYIATRARMGGFGRQPEHAR